VWLGWLIFLDVQTPGSGLGADAGQALVHYLGQWTIIVLLFAFAITPLRHWTGITQWVRHRRLVGLFAFGYATLHVLAYVALYLGFSMAQLLEDFVERPYITMGLVAICALLPMAVTSTHQWRRRLAKNWQRLHRLIYVALTAALVHLWWLTRDDFSELALYTGVFVVLCADRALRYRKKIVA